MCFGGRTLLELIEYRVIRGTATAVERALLREAGSESIGWLTRDEVAASRLGWSTEHGTPVPINAADGVTPAPGCTFRLLHRHVPLPFQASEEFFPPASGAALVADSRFAEAHAREWTTSQSGGECSALFTVRLQSTQPTSLVFLDVDHVLCANRTPYSHTHAPLHLGQFRSCANRPPHSLWQNPSLLANLPPSQLGRVALDPMLGSTCLMWRHKLCDRAALDAVGALVAFQERRPDAHFVMSTTHVAWLDSHAFREALLYPLRIVGAVWPRHVGGIISWLDTFVAPHRREIGVACLDDRSDVFQYAVAVRRAEGEVLPNTHTVCNRLVQVPRCNVRRGSPLARVVIRCSRENNMRTLVDEALLVRVAGYLDRPLPVQRESCVDAMFSSS